MSIVEDLNKIKNIKKKIYEQIEAKEIDIPIDTPFEDYPQKIQQISTSQGGGEVISALNLTGKEFAVGDKVVVSNYAYRTDQVKYIYHCPTSYSHNVGCVVSPTGKYILLDMYKGTPNRNYWYSFLVDEKLNLKNEKQYLYYQTLTFPLVSSNGLTCFGGGKSLNPDFEYIPVTNFYNFNSLFADDKKIYETNELTGEVLREVSYSISSNQSPQLILDNKLYLFYNNNNRPNYDQVYSLNFETGESSFLYNFNKKTIEWNNHKIFSGYTLDGKYLITCNEGFRIYSLKDSGTSASITNINQTLLPERLRYFLNADSWSNFNQFSQTLFCAIKGTKEFGVFQYVSEDNWMEIPIKFDWPTIDPETGEEIEDCFFNSTNGKDSYATYSLISASNDLSLMFFGIDLLLKEDSTQITELNLQNRIKPMGVLIYGKCETGFKISDPADSTINNQTMTGIVKKVNENNIDVTVLPIGDVSATITSNASSAKIEISGGKE